MKSVLDTLNPTESTTVDGGLLKTRTSIVLTSCAVALLNAEFHALPFLECHGRRIDVGYREPCYSRRECPNSQAPSDSMPR